MTEHDRLNERVNRLVYDYAMRTTRTRLIRAVDAGIINDKQADALMDMWYEDHPYESLEPKPKDEHQP